MFTLHGTRRFLRPLLSLRAGWPCAYGRITATKPLHSLQQFKRNRPVSKYKKPVKKNLKSAKNENVRPKVYTHERIRTITNLLRYSSWDSAQQQLNKLDIRWDSYTINQVLKSHPPMEKAWLFFNWTSKLRGFKHDQFTYTTMLDIFGEAKRISSMNYVFQQMQEKGIKIDAVTYTSLMHWYSNDGDVEGSVKMWKEMKDKGCTPTTVSYTAYIKILFDHNRLKEAAEVYKEMIRTGCSPNCYTYTVLMEHLAKSGKFNEVLEIFNKMQEAGVQPDKATCNILVEKCSKAGETRTLAKVLEYMKENSLVLRYAVFLEAHKTLRNLNQSDALLRHVNPHLSVEYIDEEETVGLEASTAECDSIVDQGLILVFLARKNFVAIDLLLAEMMKKNIQLHSDIISTIVDVYSSHCRLDGALLVYDYSVKMGISFKKAAYLSLIGLFIRTNSFTKVAEIVEQMVRAGLSLGTHQMVLLIYRLGRARKPAYAAKVFDLLPDDQKNTTAFTALISAYLSSGNIGKGLKTLELMRSNGIPFAVGTYNVLLDGLERRGRLREVELYRKEKKSLQAATVSQRRLSEEDMICNLLFAGDI